MKKQTNFKPLFLAGFALLILFIIKKDEIFKRDNSKENFKLQGNSRNNFKNETKNTSISPKEYFAKGLDQELNIVWKNFEKIGLTKQYYELAKQKNRDEYLHANSPSGSNQVSQKTKRFVQGIIKEHNLNPEKIIITGFNDYSPAAATESVIYINENEFNAYSKSARRFLVAHELQHIMHRDGHSHYTIELLAQNEVAKMKTDKDHPLCQYNRFKEKRADIMTALQNKQWAQAYLAFAEEQYKRFGDSAGVTHPSNTERVTLAQQIVNHMDEKTGSLNLISA